MQRRAAAISVAVFLIVGAVAYSLVATAQTPTVEFENPDYSLEEGQSFEVSGQTYTVADLSATFEGGGHGSAATLSRSGTLAWVNESARYTATWEHNATVTFQDEEWTVLVDRRADPTEFRLEATINRTAILREDPQADNETVTRQGQEYVVLTEEGETRLVPAGEYFPDPRTIEYAEGDAVDYRGNETTVATVTNESATLSWNAPRRNTVGVDDRTNVTIEGQTYLAFFPDNSTLVLTGDHESYRQQTAAIDRFHEQKNGLWGISIVSWITVVLLVGMAFLPSRY